MIFPFSIKYSNKLNLDYTKNQNELIFKIIYKHILEKKGEDIKISKDVLKFKSSFFNFDRTNFNIFTPIEKGVFRIKKENQKLIIEYQFYMYRLFLISILISLFFFLISKKVVFGLIVFCWILGINWIVAIIRHKLMLNKIVKLIEKSFNLSQ